MLATESRASFPGMETFTLILWIMMGPRFEETCIENIARDECAERWLRIAGDRELVKGDCANATSSVAPPPIRWRTIYECAHCGMDPTPGRKPS